MFQTMGKILHIRSLLSPLQKSFKKLRPREVDYWLKATQLASGRARIRARHAQLGTGQTASQKEVERLDKL